MGRDTWAGLDGLRALAVLAVVLFHASLTWGANGYAGVDVFFCLSGFLITALMLREHDARGRVDYRSFYLRRVLRLYPALVVTTLGVLALGVLVGALDRVVGGALAALFYVANWWLYTGHDALLLEHTWTLSLEEQFYVVWPGLLGLLLASSRWLRVVGLVGSLALVVAVLVPWPDGFDAVRASYLRATPIAWGSLLALAVRRWQVGPQARAALGRLALPALVALVVLLVLPVRLPEPWVSGPYGVPGVLAVVVVAAAVLVPQGWAARPLSTPALRWVGRRSYGIYLYHFPVMSLAVHQVPFPASATARALLGAVAAVLVAAASYRWVELPFLRLKDRVADRSTPPPATVRNRPPGTATGEVTP